MKFIGYIPEQNWPVKRGQSVTIPKGTTVRSTHPTRKLFVTKRIQKVVIHHILNGMLVDDRDYHRYYTERTPNAPEIETEYGKRRVISNPQIVWAGTGGYWCELDINMLGELNV